MSFLAKGLSFCDGFSRVSVEHMYNYLAVLFIIIYNFINLHPVEKTCHISDNVKYMYNIKYNTL